MNENIELLNILKDFKNHCKRYKNSFFWIPRGNAEKRSIDEENAEFPEYSFEFEGDIFEISSSAKVSGRHFYFSKSITKNGEKKDIRAITKIINKLENI